LAEFQELIGTVTEGHQNGHLKDPALMQNETMSDAD
jgi:hypothetical protein